MFDQLEDGSEVANLVITIRNKQPVELIDLAQSMLAWRGLVR